MDYAEPFLLTCFATYYLCESYVFAQVEGAAQWLPRANPAS